MPKTILKARYSVVPVPNSDLYEIGISRKDLTKLTLKVTFWSLAPYAVIFGGLFAYGTYLESKDKKSKAEVHLPVDDV